MITLLREGLYRLIETDYHNKILYLGKEVYAWIRVPDIGDILVSSHERHKAYDVLSIGDFHLYKVVDEPYLSDHIHLELEIGKEQWQGYILLTGLPKADKKRARIIPTKELIANNPLYDKRRIENPLPTRYVWKI